MIWTSVPFWPFYFAGVLLLAIALCAWLGRHGPPSTEQTARETAEAIKGDTTCDR